MHIKFTFHNNSIDANECFELINDLHLVLLDKKLVDADNQIVPSLGITRLNPEGVYYEVNYVVPDSIANHCLTQLIDKLKSMR
jgi:hypothetical protein